uniref:Uncharacterized protein n=1 Tax=Equus asinus asinus TaxID=83772 RepID=A0A8C4LPN3_EQUAS
MERTQASSWAMSVSAGGQPLTGLTSRRMEDLATSTGFLAFFSAYCRSLSSRSLAASLSSSSSLPNRSMSSSSSSSVAVAAFLVGGSTWRMGDTCCHGGGRLRPTQTGPQASSPSLPPGPACRWGGGPPWPPAPLQCQVWGPCVWGGYSPGSAGL